MARTILSREATITRRLIQEKGFTAVAVEADWPDAYRVNRYVLGRSRDANGLESLADFKCFPTWMRDTIRRETTGIQLLCRSKIIPYSQILLNQTSSVQRAVMTHG